MPSYNIQISFGAPTNIDKWNVLAHSNNSLLQSTWFDDVQRYYKYEPVYFEVYEKGRLIGGLKMYIWSSPKLGKLTSVLSHKLIQHGEWLELPSKQGEKLEAIKNDIHIAIEKFARTRNVTHLEVNGIYGPSSRLLQYPAKRIDRDFVFNVATVRLDKTDEELIRSFNRNTRRNLAKADAHGLVIEKEANGLQRFLQLMSIIYDEQQTDAHKPDFNYIQHIYCVLSKQYLVDVYVACQNGKPLAGTFFVKLGETAYSWFGGAVKNEVGAGHFAYFELMKMYREEGVRQFVFGQVSHPEMKDDSEKFAKGISVFKRGFSPYETESFSRIYILNQFRYGLWKNVSEFYQKF